jgi:hypothetical protein
MYKKQLKLQKAVCLLVLIASVIVFLYSLGIMTDLYDALYTTIGAPDNPENTRRNPVAGAFIYYDMQGFNRQFLHAGILLILASLLLFLTNTHVRRKYYVGNVFAVAVNAAACLGVTIWAGAQIRAFKAQFLQIDFEALKTFSQRLNTLYTESTFWFDVHTAVFALLILANVLLIANMIWKFRLMKEEAQLIRAGKEAAA